MFYQIDSSVIQTDNNFSALLPTNEESFVIVVIKEIRDFICRESTKDVAVDVQLTLLRLSGITDQFFWDMK